MKHTPETIADYYADLDPEVEREFDEVLVEYGIEEPTQAGPETAPADPA